MIVDRHAKQFPRPQIIFSHVWGGLIQKDFDIVDGFR